MNARPVRLFELLKQKQESFTQIISQAIKQNAYKLLPVYIVYAVTTILLIKLAKILL
jgi:hypothetical protein